MPTPPVFNNIPLILRIASFQTTSLRELFELSDVNMASMDTIFNYFRDPNMAKRLFLDSTRLTDEKQKSDAQANEKFLQALVTLPSHITPSERLYEVKSLVLDKILSLYVTCNDPQLNPELFKKVFSKIIQEICCALQEQASKYWLLGSRIVPLCKIRWEGGLKLLRVFLSYADEAFLTPIVAETKMSTVDFWVAVVKQEEAFNMLAQSDLTRYQVFFKTLSIEEHTTIIFSALCCSTNGPRNVSLMLDRIYNDSLLIELLEKEEGALLHKAVKISLVELIKLITPICTARGIRPKPALVQAWMRENDEKWGRHPQIHNDILQHLQKLLPVEPEVVPIPEHLSVFASMQTAQPKQVPQVNSSALN